MRIQPNFEDSDYEIIIPIRRHTPDLDLLLGDLLREVRVTPSPRITVKVVDQFVIQNWTRWIYGSGDVSIESDPVDIAGAAINRNRGARKSNAEWLVFLDDDVRLEPGWLGAVFGATHQNDAPDLIGGFVGSQNANNWFSQVAEDCVIRHQKNADGWYLVGAHFIMRNSAFKQLGGFNAALGSAGGEDWDLCGRAHRLNLTVGVNPSIRCFHKNPTTWSELVRRASSYALGTSSASNQQMSQMAISSHQELSSQTTANSVFRAIRWPLDRYREFRALGRSRVRSVRTVLIYIPWMSVYLWREFQNSR